MLKMAGQDHKPHNGTAGEGQRDCQQSRPPMWAAYATSVTTMHPPLCRRIAVMCEVVRRSQSGQHGLRSKVARCLWP